MPLMFSGQVMFYLLGCIGILYIMNTITKELENNIYWFLIWINNKIKLVTSLCRQQTKMLKQLAT